MKQTHGLIDEHIESIKFKASSANYHAAPRVSVIVPFLSTYPTKLQQQALNSSRGTNIFRTNRRRLMIDEHIEYIKFKASSANYHAAPRVSVIVPFLSTYPAKLQQQALNLSRGTNFFRTNRRRLIIGLPNLIVAIGIPVG